MNAQEKYQFWLKHAQYDLETADSMFQTGGNIFTV